MFTGIIEETGKIVSVNKGAKSSILKIMGNNIFSDLKIGDSVAVNGVCLTARKIEGNIFAADVMSESLSRSSLGELITGDKVNLERAMSSDGRFGGHIVSGHIDGTGRILSIKEDDNAVWYKIKAAGKLMKYIVEKGSITIDGISLTVVSLDKESFMVSVIPHTRSFTTLGEKKVGDIVNLENDIIGKYVEKFFKMEDKENKGQDKDLTMDFLLKSGF